VSVFILEISSFSLSDLNDPSEIKENNNKNIIFKNKIFCQKFK